LLAADADRSSKLAVIFAIKVLLFCVLLHALAVRCHVTRCNQIIVQWCNPSASEYQSRLDFGVEREKCLFNDQFFVVVFALAASPSAYPSWAVAGYFSVLAAATAALPFSSAAMISHSGDQPFFRAAHGIS
jgi:hypothetical protein